MTTPPSTDGNAGAHVTAGLSGIQTAFRRPHLQQTPMCGHTLCQIAPVVLWQAPTQQEPQTDMHLHTLTMLLCVGKSSSRLCMARSVTAMLRAPPMTPCAPCTQPWWRCPCILGSPPAFNATGNNTRHTEQRPTIDAVQMQAALSEDFGHDAVKCAFCKQQHSHSNRSCSAPTSRRGTPSAHG